MPRHTPHDDLNRMLYTIDFLYFVVLINAFVLVSLSFYAISYTARILLVCILLVFVSVFALVFVFYRPVSRHTPDDDI